MTALADFDVEVRHQLDELVRTGVQAITSAIAQAGQEMRATHVPAEAPVGDTGRLADPGSWHVDERDPLTHVISPGPDAFYAHIVSGGRTGFRTERPYSIDDEWRMIAGPASADPFGERAVAAAEGRTDELIDAALSAVGV